MPRLLLLLLLLPRLLWLLHWRYLLLLLHRRHLFLLLLQRIWRPLLRLLLLGRLLLPGLSHSKLLFSLRSLLLLRPALLELRLLP